MERTCSCGKPALENDKLCAECRLKRMKRNTLIINGLGLAALGALLFFLKTGRIT